MAERKSMIHVRGGFSEAHGMGSCNTQMQTDELDDRTRNILFNCISESLKEQFKNASAFGDKYLYDKENDLCKDIITFVLSKRIDSSKHYSVARIIAITEDILTNAFFNEVFDFIEFLAMHRYDKYEIEKRKGFYETINSIFEMEYVGYRFVDGRITPITDKNEIDSIEEACNNEFEGTRAHIKKAVGFIADREHKDYKNCIKESISAVESICSIVVGNEKATLGQALKRLEDNGLVIHSALKNAFSNLYGYTSDEGGVRHANGMFESDVTFEEAKFMLVSCSAFVNYLTANYGKVGGKHA
ncbi:AbiJ-NTD4 domain-containing protein [Fibrobacter sp. UWB13]|uniref:AbiJ-NTD4 domain-containing protein n=1 Tax=Fibrobacter sp. UWB13 TaxID=1896204 RepID=UPI000A1C9F24|nr:hypothetical protein [Fibrobacter sp. UWB13]